ncbi:hypothetical protein [Aeromicrobium sp. CF3.5]|uniref:hypothetical protein n=1 Tax=Aeromicrobium sp. CF3.5 TaxID=3373078 RepID=UPI003EE6DE0D
MSTEVLLLAATAVLAVVAVMAALIAVRAVRRLDRASAPSDQTVRNEVATSSSASAELVRLGPDPSRAPAQQVVRLVEGRVVVSPTQEQVVATALGRPAARASVYAAGLAHALRPESRDRIQAIVRREFRRRRRLRQRVARRAARQIPSRALHPDETWLSGGTPSGDQPRVVGE